MPSLGRGSEGLNGYSKLSLGTRKKIRYQFLPVSWVHCFANVPYDDQDVWYFI